MVIAHNIDEGQRTQDVKIKEDITFESILLAKKTLSGLKKAGFYKPSPIQLHGIPLGKCGFDLLLEAKSGTGKTAVFTVIALEKLDLQKGLQVIILAPTREIAAQICHVIREIGADYSGLGVEVVMGGLPVQEDVSKFKSKLVHIVVGSPGRLKHLILDKHIDVSAVRLLVLDECDKLVEKSFLTDINAIFSILPRQKQVIMSSATYPEKCKLFISKFVHNAQHICPDTSTILLGITQKVTLVKYNYNIVKQTENRLQELLKIMSTKQFKQCLIFCNYQARVAELHRFLTKEKWPAELLYGQQEQNNRLYALKTLQEYKCRILISTDLAARGIDASNVDLVINFEPPYDWQTYLHRIGRAGRYGSFGTAITILTEGKEVTKFKELFHSVDLSLNLRNFWTDDEFGNSSHYSDLSNLDKSDFIQAEKEIPPDLLGKDLWDILISENEKDIESSLTFVELQKSFQMSCSTSNKIESFTDLITSFEHSSDFSNQFMKYPLVNTIQIPINNYLTSFQNEDIDELELDNMAQSNQNINPMVNVTSEKNTDELHLTITPSQSKDVDEKDHCEYSSKIEYKTNTTQYNEEFLMAPENCNYDHSQGNVYALIEAGLPTSFGKSKRKDHCNKKYLQRNDNNVIKKKNVTSTNHLGPVNDKPTFASLNPNFKSLHEKSIESTIKAKDTAFSRRSLKTSHLNSDSPINNGYKNYTTSHTQQTKNDTCVYYENWFNQLKRYKEYIEYVVYIDEMSKL